MSEAINAATSPFDIAIETLRERERQLDTDAQCLLTRRDEVRDMIALLTSRRPRPTRKPRAAADGAAAETAAEPPAPAHPFRFAPALVSNEAEA